MDIQRNEILIGNGMLFPIKLTQNDLGETGWYPVKGDLELIKNNLRTLVECHIGQRFRQEYYGTRIWECLEEPAIPMLLYMVNYFIQETISLWEPRISFSKVEGYMKGSEIYLELRYILSGYTEEQSLEIQFNDISNHE